MAVTTTRPIGRLTSPVTSYYLLASSTALLVVVGLAVVLSSSSIDSIKKEGDPFSLFKAQVVYLVIGVALCILVSRGTVAFYKALGPWLLFGSILTLILVALSPWGRSTGGNRNWLDFGDFSAQPSEAAKLALALYLGLALSHMRSRLSTLRGALVPAGVVAGLVVALVLAGGDIGTAAVMILLVSAAFWTAGLPFRFFAAGSLAAVSGLAMLIALRPALLERVTAWWSPGCDELDECFQVTHGTWALASGGVWGLGPGLSREKWSYLPEASNDFIYAILGEEFGLVGTVFVLVALAMIVLAVNRIVQRHRDPFVQVTAAAIGAWIVGQACLNIAVVIGLAPVTGVPLPLVSSGGSSLVTSLVGIGILLGFARGEPGAREALAARRVRRMGDGDVIEVRRGA
ncbi:MAG: cell division protein FtsW [Demequinaceae bacterium]|nr:cell division protein FtsW [Demequinaceae bacterium]